MTDHKRVIARMRARIGAVLGLRTAVAVLSAWLLLWGTAVLLLRGIWLVPREPLTWGAVGIAAAILVGIVVAKRRAPTAKTIRALLDSHWRCGGLLMAEGDNVDAARWPVAVPDEALPSVRWDGRRQSGILFCSALYVGIGFAMPTRYLNELGAQRLLVGAEVEKLADKVELLKEEKILPPERAKSLEMALEQLQNEASGSDPAKTWEAMDHLDQSISKASAEAAEDASREAEKAAKAEELAQALDKAGGEMGSKELSEAMNILAKDVQAAAKESDLLTLDLPEDLLKDLENGSLDAGDLADLAKALGKCKACELGKLRKLVKVRLIDGECLGKCEGKCKECDPDALAALLCLCKGGSECAALCNGRCPGRGGVTRGRADAEMTWTDGANREGTEFKEQVLPPAAAASLKDARLQGISVGDPTSAEPGEASTGGALTAAASGRGSARTQVILPEHKKVIGRYFARNPSGKTPAPANP